MTGFPGKTGIVYTVDRATGEFLWATPTVARNVVGGIDEATGAVSANRDLVFGSFREEVLACPTAMAARTGRRAPTPRAPTRCTCRSATSAPACWATIPTTGPTGSTPSPGAPRSPPATIMSGACRPSRPRRRARLVLDADRQEPNNSRLSCGFVVRHVPRFGPRDESGPWRSMTVQNRLATAGFGGWRVCAEPFRCHVIAALRGSSKGVGDRIDLLAEHAAAGDPPRDGAAYGFRDHAPR